MDWLLNKMEDWSKGNWLEMRAAAAGLAEPALLQEEEHILRTLKILDQITSAVEAAQDRGEEFKILRQGLGYCWSVVVAALPAQGKQAMERRLSSPDKDVRWILKENLKKKRLAKMGQDWVSDCLAQMNT